MELTSIGEEQLESKQLLYVNFREMIQLFKHVYFYECFLFWRSALKQDEKVFIRNELLSCVATETDNDLAIQLSLIISKMARYDFPRFWPDLLSRLLGNLESAGEMHRKRSLQTLHRVIKSLCSKLLPEAKKCLYEMAAELMTFLRDLWMGFVRMGQWELAFLSLKCMRFMYVYGFKDLVTLVEGSNDEFPRLLLDLLQQLFSSENQGDDLFKGKLKILIGKCFIHILELHPYAFVLSPSCMQSVNFYFSFLKERNAIAANDVEERICLQGLILLRGLVRNVAFHDQEVALDGMRGNAAFGPLISKEISNYEIVLCKSQDILEGLFTESTVCLLCEMLVMQYLILTPNEYESFANDPETFVIEEAASEQQWRFNLKMCAECAFEDLMIQHGDLLGRKLADLFLHAGKKDFVFMTHLLDILFV